MTGGAFYGVQSLWARPYLHDVNGLDAAYAAGLVSLLGIAMMAGNVGLGALARRLERMGLGLYGFGGACMVLFLDRKSTRLNSSHVKISYAVFCLKKKNKQL